ncbi:hypothetical protein M758_4G173000 [Ceratodon purpureus]|uniref:Uncharacterized protein n=1 Tax=Ceratodon purpureus TaxID=3225 RepID=A0A8T0IC43_CERPU|nr:hypothetical protein KC19_4G171400 [Ceratodon purpureus]KAG0619892.1 hypothetical protein M758_4G173000 [Ceratodon purpureus]
MSPNVGPLFGAKGWLDYYLYPHRWGFELLVDGSDLKEHQGRFEPGGVYHKLIEDGVVSTYAILDFRSKRLVDPKPDVLHIVFSEDFEEVALHRSGRSPRKLMLKTEVRGCMRVIKRIAETYNDEIYSYFIWNDVHDKIFGTDKGYRKLKVAENEHN